ncbi:MAG TPA: NAD(P)-dependent oxidoreductase [Polyangiales bacterium]|nr:NAD(P)-dependent oxidoreductase [Polyangiales bacterium]
MEVTVDATRTRRSLCDARVLVTGSSGFIGQHLCHRLHAEGAHLVLLQREPRAVPWPNARCVHAHSTERADIAATLRQTQPDIVFHLAGFVSGDRSREAVVRAFDANVMGSANILLTCLTQLPHARVIFTSSLEASNPLRDTASTGSAYGISKLMVEVLSGTLHELYSSPMFTARLGMVYGPGDANSCRLVPAVIRAFLNRETPHLSSGRRRSDWVYIDDVVAGLVAMASATDLRQAALDLASGELHSVREVAELIASLMAVSADLPIDFDASLDRPHEQERVADMATTRQLLQLGAATDLRTGLARTIEAYRADCLRPSSPRRSERP